MISDVLSEAGALRDEIERVVQEMDRIRTKLDQLPMPEDPADNG